MHAKENMKLTLTLLDAIVGKTLSTNKFTVAEALQEVENVMITKRIIPCLDVKDGRCW